jgi:hypothetical protein
MGGEKALEEANGGLGVLVVAEEGEEEGQCAIDLFLSGGGSTVVSDARVRCRQPRWRYSSTRLRKIIMFFFWRAVRRALNEGKDTPCSGTA